MNESNEIACELDVAGRVLECHTRFLHPFVVAANRGREMAAALEQFRFGEVAELWQVNSLPENYREEMLAPLLRLFAVDDAAESLRSYLRVADAALNRMFHDAVVQFGDISLPVEPVWSTGIELFLLDAGIGVLSVSLEVEADSLTAGQVVDFNYRLTQPVDKSRAVIRTAHPQDSPAAWQRVPEAERAKIAPAPAEDAPLAERVGVRGGQFGLAELCDALLRPLQEFAFRTLQPQLSVYSVVRMSDEFDLEVADVQQRSGPFLSALAQIEESTHVGSTSRELSVPERILNRKHWAAVGLFGAAHLVGDQADTPDGTPHPYNTQRVPRVRDKYFMPFLAALMQRLVLHRTVEAAADLLPAAGVKLPGEYAELRRSLLGYAVSGRLTHVTNRHAAHRYYELAREGLHVDEAWDDVERAMSQVDARLRADQEEKMSGDMHQNLALVAHTQKMIEWIEIFLVSVYGAHLWFMVGEAIHIPGKTLAVGVILFALAGGLVTAWMLKPWRHVVRGQKHHGDGTH
ncbi:MAG: hypothetical protein DWQ42_00385 [Planctomycetota bacterium]|nr:MAG: hypothetical protein DWQ42_00385 [Planctomycetota bacterium]REK40650.1 MAG: hypothetical protein DWQ46_15525 [Planctomycetota bacterium]